MAANHIERLEQVRHWIRSLEQRPGVYLIENRNTGACYVGCAKKSLRQRLQATLSALQSEKHHAYLLQTDWLRYGAECFAWWAKCASSAQEAIQTEKELAVAANAFEDFGGYCQRTGKNCAAASFRETERKLAKARIRRYQFLPGIRIEERVSEVLLRTANLHMPNQQHKDTMQKANVTELAAWKTSALRLEQSDETSDAGLTAQGAMCDFLDRQSVI